MTRDFNKQRRNDSRPPFRNSSSSNHNRDERAPRSSRPRLNREAVDRAWESGAPQRHADYRPRDNSSQRGQYGNSPRNTQHSHHNYNSHNGKPRVNNRYGESHYDPQQEHHERRYPDRREEFYHEPQDRRGNRRDGYRDNRNESSSHFSRQGRRPNTSGNSSYGNEGQRFNRRDDYQSHDRHHQGHERNGYDESRHGYGSRNRSSSSYRSSQGRDQRRDDRPYERRDREQHTPYQQGRSSSRPYAGQRAQFEGDYESFNEQNERDERPNRPPRSNERPFRGSPNTHEERPTHGRRDIRRSHEEQPRERHLTPLPDGRVLKGPRPVQRRNARFWTDISQETDELIHHVSAGEQDDIENGGVSEELPELSAVDAQTVQGAAVDDEQSEQDTDEGNTSSETEQESSTESPRRRTRAASAVVRGKKDKGVHGSSAAMKPSQRGFKWPTS